MTVLTAVYGSVMGAKMVTFYPRNADLQKHTHLATIQLFRSDTGGPLALMDGRLITEMRTAAVSAVAIDLLARPQSKVLAILGSGVPLARSRAVRDPVIHRRPGLEPFARSRAKVRRRNRRSSDHR